MYLTIIALCVPAAYIIHCAVTRPLLRHLGWA